jgi:hypothetical protein
VVWGKHSFDNTYEYHFRFYLSDLTQRQVENTSSIPVTEIEDSTQKPVVFIQLKGTGGNYKISHDTRATLDNFRANWKKERQSVKQILKEEFSRKNQSTIKETGIKNNKISTPTVILEEIKTDEPKTPTKSQKKGPAIEWKDDDN